MFIISSEQLTGFSVLSGAFNVEMFAAAIFLEGHNFKEYTDPAGAVLQAIFCCFGAALVFGIVARFVRCWKDNINQRISVSANYLI